MKINSKQIFEYTLATGVAFFIGVFTTMYKIDNRLSWWFELALKVSCHSSQEDKCEITATNNMTSTVLKPTSIKCWNFYICIALTASLRDVWQV